MVNNSEIGLSLVLKMNFVLNSLIYFLSGNPRITSEIVADV